MGNRILARILHNKRMILRRQAGALEVFPDVIDRSDHIGRREQVDDPWLDRPRRWDDFNSSYGTMNCKFNVARERIAARSAREIQNKKFFRVFGQHPTMRK